MVSLGSPEQGGVCSRCWSQWPDQRRHPGAHLGSVPRKDWSVEVAEIPLLRSLCKWPGISGSGVDRIVKSTIKYFIMNNLFDHNNVISLKFGKFSEYK